ncbi:MAG: DnaJ domain-containing protein [Deltaproteobacteria bacterium]|nr:DnaJ domain-containing protein [Deltaproteobacteria bacterium]
MSLTKPFHDARELLGVGIDADATAIKRAWRKAAAVHPPDRDPDGFRKARDAYELLSDPIERAQRLLSQPVPFVPVPSLPELPPPPPVHALAVELLRSILGRLPVSDLRPARKPARSTQPPGKQP